VAWARPNRFLKAEIVVHVLFNAMLTAVVFNTTQDSRRLYLSKTDTARAVLEVAIMFGSGAFVLAELQKAIVRKCQAYSRKKDKVGRYSHHAP
jgi:hypothetical protein